MKILITHGWCRTAFGVASSLGQAGHEVIVASSQRLAMAGFSRFATRRYKTPDPFEEPRSFVESIARVAVREAIDVVLPVHEDSYPLRRLASLLPDSCLLACPELEQLDRTLDKGCFAQVLEHAGLPAPQTFVPESMDAARTFLQTARYPLLTKTRRGNGGKGVLILSDRAEGFARYQAHAAALGLEESPPLLQEFIPGELLGTCFLADSGRLIYCFGERYLRMKERGFGSSVYREPVEHPELRAAAARVVEAIQFHGIGQIDFVVRSDGTPLPLELNPRFWGGLELALANGFDFPAAYLDLLAGHSYHHHFRSGQRNKRSLWLVGEGMALAQELLERKDLPSKIGASLRRLREADSFDDFRWDDPLPLFVEGLNYLSRFVAAGGKVNPSSPGMFGQTLEGPRS